MTYADCVSDAEATLRAAGFAGDEARRDAAVLARAHLGWSTARWLVDARTPCPADFMDALAMAVARRATREPVAYITGEREFYGRAFAVSPGVLVPRPETELLIDLALEWLDATSRVSDETAPAALDIGTGSGCLAVTLACERALPVVATDVSVAALDVARRNARTHGVESRVTLIQQPFAAGRRDAFDLIVSNPPYVPETDRAALAPDVREHEPALALFGGPDGLDVIRALLPAVRDALRPGGRLLMEIGFGQDDAVRELTTAAGLDWHGTRADLAAIPRVVIASRAL